MRGGGLDDVYVKRARVMRVVRSCQRSDVTGFIKLTMNEKLAFS